MGEPGDKQKTLEFMYQDIHIFPTFGLYGRD